MRPSQLIHPGAQLNSQIPPGRHVGAEFSHGAGHARPHAPQFAESVRMSTQRPGDNADPPPQMTSPSLHTTSGATKASRGLPASSMGVDASAQTSGTGGASARDGGASAAVASTAASTAAPASAQTHAPSVPSAPHV